MFSSLLARFSPTHTWDESSNDDKRTCQVCGRVEHYEDTDGWVAPSWRLLRAGDKRAHVAAAKSATPNVQSPAILVLKDEAT
jgi:hypothetical protein